MIALKISVNNWDWFLQAFDAIWRPTESHIWDIVYLCRNFLSFFSFDRASCCCWFRYPRRNILREWLLLVNLTSSEVTTSIVVSSTSEIVRIATIIHSIASKIISLIVISVTASIIASSEATTATTSSTPSAAASSSSFHGSTKVHVSESWLISIEVWLFLEGIVVWSHGNRCVRVDCEFIGDWTKLKLRLSKWTIEFGRILFVFLLRFFFAVEDRLVNLAINFDAWLIFGFRHSILSMVKGGIQVEFWFSRFFFCFYILFWRRRRRRLFVAWLLRCIFLLFCWLFLFLCR